MNWQLASKAGLPAITVLIACHSMSLQLPLYLYDTLADFLILVNSFHHLFSPMASDVISLLALYFK